MKQSCTDWSEMRCPFRIKEFSILRSDKKLFFPHLNQMIQTHKHVSVDAHSLIDLGIDQSWNRLHYMSGQKGNRQPEKQELDLICSRKRKKSKRLRDTFNHKRQHVPGHADQDVQNWSHKICHKPTRII